MIPAVASGLGEARKPFPFGFSPRFLVAIALGLLWLIPAWSRPQLISGMVAWDLAGLLVWFWDWLRLPDAGRLRAVRSWSSTITQAEETLVALQLHNASDRGVVVDLMEQVPAALCELPALSGQYVEAHGSASMRYVVRARERGNHEVGGLFVRYRSGLGFAERWGSFPLEQTICVYPAAIRSKEQALYLIRSRQADLQKRQRRQPGMGREFESLREYREGDEMRDVSWTASARRHQLVSRVYTAERSQTVWVVVDAGRLLGAQVPKRTGQAGEALSKLDLAVSAAASLVEVSIQHGDHAGLLVYGRAVQQVVAPGRGPAQMRRVSDALAQARVEAQEANHGRAARVLTQKQSRRALIIWITDFAETPAMPEVIEYAAYLGKRHLVLLAAIEQPDLKLVAERAPRTESEMFRHAAALEIAGRRELLLRQLRQAGVLALELTPENGAVALVNEYLKIKDRNLL